MPLLKCADSSLSRNNSLTIPFKSQRHLLGQIEYLKVWLEVVKRIPKTRIIKSAKRLSVCCNSWKIWVLVYDLVTTYKCLSDLVPTYEWLSDLVPTYEWLCDLVTTYFWLFDLVPTYEWLFDLVPTYLLNVCVLLCERESVPACQNVFCYFLFANLLEPKRFTFGKTFKTFC